MIDIDYQFPGLSVTAQVAPTRAGQALGVYVEWHPGIASDTRRLILESIMRRWQSEVGHVKRGRRPVKEDCVFLPGWQVYVYQKGSAVRLRIALSTNMEGDEDAGAQSSHVPAGHA